MQFGSRQMAPAHIHADFGADVQSRAIQKGNNKGAGVSEREKEHRQQWLTPAYRIWYGASIAIVLLTTAKCPTTVHCLVCGYSFSCFHSDSLLRALLLPYCCLITFLLCSLRWLNRTVAVWVVCALCCVALSASMLMFTVDCAASNLVAIIDVIILIHQHTTERSSFFY